MCRVLEVSRSGYRAWRRRPLSRRSLEEQALLLVIQNSFKKSDGTYGSPRIHPDVQALNPACSLNRVARIMHKHGIAAQIKKRFKKTTDSEHDLPIAENIVKQNFVTEETNSVWTGDITYIWTTEGWLYLAVLLDLSSRRAIGWSMSDSLDRSIVVDTLRMALQDRQPGPGLICHSDRGSQYASDDYRKLIKDARARCSMSRKGNCYDNAPAESFFATLKRELVYKTSFKTRKEARAAIFYWIAVWYNRNRRHSSIGYISPDQFEQQRRKAA